MDLEALQANYRPVQFGSTATPQKPQASGAKRLLASALPIVGGALGAIGGSFVAPVAGTAAGGAAGSALGEALRQRLLGEKTNIKGIATEGVLGALPGVFKGAKVAAGAIKSGEAADAARGILTAEGRLAKTRESVIANGKRVAGLADNSNPSVATVRDTSRAEINAANREGRLANPLNKTDVSVNSAFTDSLKNPVTPATAEATPKGASLLNKLSNNLTKSGSGLKVGGNVGDIERVDDTAEMFRRLKITGTPDKQLRKISETMKSHSKSVDDILAKNPIQLDGAAVKAQVTKAIQDPTKYAELDLTTPGAQRALNAHLDKFASAKTAKEINDYVKVLNPIASRAQDKLVRGVALTDKEAAALAAKKSGDEVLSEFPEIKPFKKDMAQLFEHNPNVAKQSEKAAGIPILGIKSKGVQQAMSGAKSKVGSIVGKADEVASSAPVKNGKTVGKSLFNQFVTRAVAAPLAAESQPENDPNMASMTDPTMATTSMPASTSSIDPLNPNADPNASANPMAEYETAAREALARGDYEGLNAILKYVEAFGPSTAPQKPLSAEASKVLANANSGLDSLNQLEQMIAEDPSVVSKTVIPGRGAFGGALGGALGTTSYDTAAKNITDVITRLRTGAALTDSEEAFYKSQLPQAFDPPETRAQKIQMFRDLFSSVANRTGTAGTDVQAAVGL